MIANKSHCPQEVVHDQEIPLRVDFCACCRKSPHGRGPLSTPRPHRCARLRINEWSHACINKAKRDPVQPSRQTETEVATPKSLLRDHRISMVSPVRSASSSHSTGPSRLLLQVTWKSPGPWTCIARYRRDLAFSNCTSESTCITKHDAHALTASKVLLSSLIVREGVNGPFPVTERIWRDGRPPWLMWVAKAESS